MNEIVAKIVNGTSAISSAIDDVNSVTNKKTTEKEIPGDGYDKTNFGEDSTERNEVPTNTAEEMPSSKVI